MTNIYTMNWLRYICNGLESSENSRIIDKNVARSFQPNLTPMREIEKQHQALHYFFLSCDNVIYLDSLLEVEFVSTYTWHTLNVKQRIYSSCKW